MPTAAIWGAGSIAHTHAEALRACGIPIAAVVSRRESAAGEFAARWGITRFGTDPAILFEDGIDCIHICTPPSLHYEMDLECLTRGKHVLCEKPLCMEDDQARHLARVARQKQLVCAVNFNVRFHTACREARNKVQSPDFGRVLLIHGNYLQEFGALPAPMDWRYDPRLAGKMHAVTEIGTHWMDIAQCISGRRISAVSAQFGNFWPVRHLESGMMHADTAPGRSPVTVSGEDAAIISLRFEDGAIGVVTLSEVSQGRYNHLSLEITGEKQSLWWNSEQSNLLNFAHRGGTVQSHVFAFAGGFPDTFRALMATVYQDVANGVPGSDPEYPTFRDGMYSVLLCNAIFESACHNSVWITLPEQED